MKKKKKLLENIVGIVPTMAKRVSALHTSWYTERNFSVYPPPINTHCSVSSSLLCELRKVVVGRERPVDPIFWTTSQRLRLIIYSMWYARNEFYPVLRR